MSTPKAQDVKVFVPTEDFELSISFYQALGWTLNWRESGLAEVELGKVRLYLQDYFVKAWAHNFMIYVVVENATEWHQHIARVIDEGDYASARVQTPKKEEYGALVTYAWDPCGVLLHFAQPLNDG